MSCKAGGKFRWFYTGNQVGDLNHTGDFNFVAGGPPGSGISAGVLAKLFFADPANRAQWENDQAVFNQELLDASFPFIELNFVVDIILKNDVFRVSNKNIYVKDKDGLPRFYEARIPKAPSISITQGEWLSPNFEIGDLSFNLNNRDGYFNPWLPHGEKYEQWLGAEVKVYVGYGEEFSNYFNIYTGFVTPKKGVESTDQELRIRCYDVFDQDEIPIPALSFNEDTFPELDPSFVGAPIPLIYGDWTVEVESWGEIPGIITNALASNPSFYEVKVAENSLQSIDEVYLHRGDRAAGESNGPIRFDDAQIQKDLENGRVVVPASGQVLVELYELFKKERAGSGSGLNTITADNPSTNFLTGGVKPGDIVTKLSTFQKGTVLSVANALITISGGITFAEGDDFAIQTNQYTFLNGDKISVKCKGKNVKVISTNRIADAGIANAQPTGLTLSLSGSYIFADNSTQKIYEISFKNEVLREWNYADIDLTLSNITGLSLAFDQSLWILDGSSRIRRWLIDDEQLGLSFTTADVFGLGALLTQPRGLTIDAGNIITLVDNASGQFYRIDPFTPLTPTLLGQFNRSAFDATATDITDLSADVNLNHIVVIDRVNHKFYRIDPMVGTLIASSDFDYYTAITDQATYMSGVSVSQDGTVFFVDQATRTVYNYNEAVDANDNPGWIARDIIQKYAGKVSNDFDLVFNQTCREDMSQFKTRAYINESSSIVTYCTKLLQQFNTSLYVRFQKYALFFISFENFRIDGDIIREGDIKMGSFNPSKEYSQYFNTANADMNYRPFSNENDKSDTYASAAGITSAGKEITRKLSMKNVYRREDIDVLMPLFVRLSVPEPEFVSLTLGFRFLFTQINDFFMINFDDVYRCIEGYKPGGRRFNNIPAFVRKIEFDLSDMSLKMKLWSLGTTGFNGFTPVGNPPGGQFDPVILTNLGTPGYVSPTGIITASGLDNVTIEDVNGANAELRDAAIVGKAWPIGAVVDLVDASDHSVVATTVIEDVQGDVITFADNLPIVPTPTVKNVAGFAVSGHYLRYSDFDQITVGQQRYFGSFTKPVDLYPITATSETEEQRAGTHNFDNDRIPYILHPVGFVPN